MFRTFGAAICAAILVLCLTVASGTAATAQTISQPTGNNNVQFSFIGQSFTATTTGVVTHIRVRPRENRTTTVDFYNGATTGSSSNFGSGIGSPVSSQAVTISDIGSDTVGFQTIALVTPLPVTSGQVYSFSFRLAYLAVPGSNVYGGGTLFVEGDTVIGANDLAFEVVQGPAPPVPVPTVSEWTMILLGLMLAAAAGSQIQRARRAT